MRLSNYLSKYPGRCVSGYVRVCIYECMNIFKSGSLYSNDPDVVKHRVNWVHVLI